MKFTSSIAASIALMTLMSSVMAESKLKDEPIDYKKPAAPTTTPCDEHNEVKPDMKTPEPTSTPCEENEVKPDMKTPEPTTTPCDEHNEVKPDMKTPEPTSTPCDEHNEVKPDAKTPEPTGEPTAEPTAEPSAEPTEEPPSNVEYDDDVQAEISHGFKTTASAMLTIIISMFFV